MNLSGARWRKSSRSDNGGNSCVEVADGLPGMVGVRDSTDRQGPVLTFHPRAWRSFVRAVAGPGIHPADRDGATRPR